MGGFGGGGVVVWVWVFFPLGFKVRVGSFRVSVWKILIRPFDESRSLLCLLLPHLGGGFPYSLIPCRPRRRHHQCPMELSSTSL